MKKGFRLVLICLVWVSPHTFADYFLKFETSGGSHDPDTLFSANTNAWIKLSIVGTYPTDGPVHYPGSHTGAFTRYNHLKTVGVDHTRFYFAEVPRSVTIINKSDGAKSTITEGDVPVTFAGAPSPAFYMPDSLLVTTGLSKDFVADVFNVFMAAAMPVSRYGDQGNPFGIINKSGSNYTETYSRLHDTAVCASGWAPSSTDGDGFTMVQAVNHGAGGNGSICYARMMSKGKISHVVRYQ